MSSAAYALLSRDSSGLDLAMSGVVPHNETSSSVEEILRVARGSEGGVHLVTVPVALDPNEERLLESESERLGFVCVGATPLESASLTSEVMHRHAIVLCRGGTDTSRASSAVRRLARVSPRRHVLVWPCGAMPSRSNQPQVEPRTDSYARRATRWLRRGRPRTADTWLRAALATSERGTGGVASWLSYADTATLWADRVIARGRLQEADAWVRSLEAEGAMRGSMPASVRERRVRIDFWLGRNAEDTEETEGAGRRSAEETGWMALAAWRDGRDARLACLREWLTQCGAAGDARAAMWTSILGAVVDREIANAITKECAVPGWLLLLLKAAVGRAHLLRGEREAAAIALADVRGSEPESELVRALKRQAAQASDAAQRLLGGISCPGIRSFLVEKQRMVTVDTFGRLLAVMESSPDEFAALTAGCGWVREAAPNVRVGIVSADGLKLIAGLGWKASDTSGAIAGLLKNTGHAAGGFSLPIRHAATPIAHVVVGPGERAHLLCEPAHALATLAGPTVRTCLDDLDVRSLDRDGLREILGRSQAIVSVRTAIGRAAATTFPVLIEGPSGTGKELAARAIHKLSARRDRRFLAVNCAALTDELVEAELFGHARGAFTGAVGPRPGLFEEANGGTLFLDEVAELSPRAQAKLLRVLQEREVRRVGENGPRSVDVRIVSATNTPLADAAASGRFRVDLRFRLSVVSIRLPSLQERLEDVPLLSHVFWRRSMAEIGKRAWLGPDVLARLTRYEWPGNVRELQNVISGLAVAAPTYGRVNVRHLVEVMGQAAGEPLPEPSVAAPSNLNAARTVFERRHVAEALARHAGRRAQTARSLGLTRQGLSKAMRRLGLEEGRERGVA